MTRRLVKWVRDRASRLARVALETAGAARERFAGLPVISEGWISKEMLTRCLATARPTILEIGANDGEHTLWFLELFERPRIHCFEPDPRALKRFRQRVGEEEAVTVSEIAIGESDGVAVFFQSDGVKGDGTVPEPEEGWDYSGSLRQPKRHLEVYPWVKFERTITVPARSLDSWCAEHQVRDVDLIWMDVQGAELDVIRGARQVLGRTRYLFTEYSNLELYAGQVGLRELLDNLMGFEVVARFREDILLANLSFDPPGIAR